MPGGPIEGFKRMQPILEKIAAQSNSGPCVTYIGPGGAGNYVKMIHNGIEYGDMQLIAESYDILKNVGGLTNPELQQTFTEWNKTELESFLIEITSIIFGKKDEDGSSFIVDKIVDKTGSKGTGKWTVQEAAEQGVAAPTMSSALDARYLSSLLEERMVAAKILKGPEVKTSALDAKAKADLVQEVRYALYAAKICSYAQGMNLIRTAGQNNKWPLELGSIARIWKGGCIIRAVFLDRIKSAYDKNPKLSNLLIDDGFAADMNVRQAALRKVVSMAVASGIATPSFSASLAYYDSYRRARHPANLTQAQRDLFGAHGYQRLDKKPPAGEDAFHTEWLKK
jgi:6-phosphogluconate dehydrogenase